MLAYMVEADKLVSMMVENSSGEKSDVIDMLIEQKEMLRNITVGGYAECGKNVVSEESINRYYAHAKEEYPDARDLIFALWVDCLAKISKAQFGLELRVIVLTGMALLYRAVLDYCDGITGEHS